MPNLSNKFMELLAPAGDWDALMAGLAAGADAFYLGGKLFNARQSAANFDLKQLQEASDLIHLHGKKMYVTVNTLIADTELEAAINFLTQLYNLGVDAVIVQDLGLINLARKYLPGLTLHASTQMTIHNREGASYLKDLGIKRVVLARELTKDEVEAIATQAEIEVEVFIHGALCICYSGQCLMSSMIGGRSGNRGRCAQPCRMEYQLGRVPVNTGVSELIPLQGSYLLSPKDQALISEIPELQRAGVTSLKIEGRMKRPEYVYNVLKIYRRALDRFYEDPAAFTVEPSELRDLEQSFNRGFTTGYFGGNRNESLMSFSRPNNRGLYLGRIMESSNAAGQVIIKLQADLEVGDEVEVWVSKGGRTAGPVQSLRRLFFATQSENSSNMGDSPKGGLPPKGGQSSRDGLVIDAAKAGEKVTFTLPGQFFAGDRVFKVFSLRSDQETKQALSKENNALKIPCSCEIYGESGSALRIIYRDNLGNQGSATTEANLQRARTRPITRELLWEQLNRLGNTPYYLTTLNTTLEEGLMIPLSELNQARRQAIDELTMQKLKLYHREPVKVVKSNLFSGKNHHSQMPKEQSEISIWAADLPGVIAAAEAGANLIYAGGDELTGFQWTEERFLEAIEQAHQAGTKLVIGLPRINREGQREQWYPYFNLAVKVNPDGLMVSDLGTLQLALAESDRLLCLNYTLNFFNSFAAAGFDKQRIKHITISPELTLTQIKQVKREQPDIRLECLVQGPMELMVSEYCPMDSILTKTGKCTGSCRKNHYFLRDRLNLDFPIFTDQFCRIHLLNAKDLCLYEDIEKLLEIPGLLLRLELKTATAEQIHQLVSIYKTALKDIFNRERSGDLEKGIEKIKSLTGQGITKGHYFRGVE